MTDPPETATRTFGPRPPRVVPVAGRGRSGLAEALTRPATLLALVVVAALALTLVAWPTGRRPSSAAPVRPGYLEVLEGLDAHRAAAFATGESAGLLRVYVPGAPALAADEAVLRAYVGQGRRVAGLRHELTSVTVVHEAADRVELRVVDTMAPFRVVDAAGRVVERHAGRAARAWLVTLEQVGGRWRVAGLVAE